MHNITNHGQCILYMAISMQIIYTYVDNILSQIAGRVQAGAGRRRQAEAGIGRQRHVGDDGHTSGDNVANCFRTLRSHRQHRSRSALKTNFPKV